ncbi:MAG TPA: FtsX-like permease family protein [Candidatus Methylacidiphilales bacterium]|nr:FtsX-like permease family protein [Candidatus Methylacidiphilales bacterium]
MNFLHSFFTAWTWRMAWRDSRSSRGKLLLFSCSIILGVAALAAIGSLGNNLERAVEEQAKTLLGADLMLLSQVPFSPEAEELFKEIGGEQSREISFASMVHFPRTDGTRLSFIRALEGRFPFYGTLETVPMSAGQDFRSKSGAVADESLMTQFEVKPGDTVTIGGRSIPVLGQLNRVPGETMLIATFAPRIYISMAEARATGLLRAGSLASYKIYFRFGLDTPLPALRGSSAEQATAATAAPNADNADTTPAGKRSSPILNKDGTVNTKALVEKLNPRLSELRLGADTVDERKKDLGRALDNLYHFLNLVGFIALLLGGVGVASAIHAHVKEKLSAVAVLRCLGCSIAQTFAIYLIQGMALGAFGAGIGALFGIAVQQLLPTVLGDFLPFEFTFHTSWEAVGRAMGIGFAICLAFTLLPLLAVRRVSPLAAIRSSYDPNARRIDPWQAVVGLAIAGGVVWFCLAQTANYKIGLGFAGGLAAAFLVLTFTAWLLIWITRRSLPLLRLAFTARQGLANLYRPGNRTLLLLLSLGLGTFLLVTLYLVQYTLLKELVPEGPDGRPNAIMYGISNDQLSGVKDLLKTQNLPVLDEAPIISMRILSIKGRTVADIMADERRAREAERARRDQEKKQAKQSGTTNSVSTATNPPVATPAASNAPSTAAGTNAAWPVTERGGTPSRGAAPEALAASMRPRAWALRREYRSSYNDKLRDSEKITKGQWIGRMPGTEPKPGETAPAEIDLATAVVPISVEEKLARDLGVDLGDELVFDVQGLPVKTKVTSLREVNWRRIQTNFFILFPRGALESAPAMHVVVSRVPDAAASAKIQRAMIRSYPSVSTIDMTLVVQTLDSILGKISFVIRFMAMFTVLTGLLVLIASLATGRYQRIQESVLLRTLGASRGQIFRILLAEYLALGALAALTGVGLAVGATWVLMAYVFQTGFTPPLTPLLAAMLGLPALTVATGLLMSRGVLNHPPLAVLRGD